MEVYYINSKKQKICFTEKPYILLDGASIVDYSLSYSMLGKTNNKISIFKNQMKKGNMTVIVEGKTRQEYCTNINKLMDVVSCDVELVTPGMLYCGKEYCKGYFVGVKHGTNYNNSKRAELELEFMAENGKWIKETRHVFRTDASMPSETANLDYPHDFNYDFYNNLISQKLYNTGIAPVDFELTIYGACLNPAVKLGGHTYRVYASVETGEYLKINSVTKKIYKVKVNGEIVNQFYLRDKDNYIFKKIPSGNHAVTWSGAYGFDITLFEERSEPEWI